ncbi:uncharacterized protein BXZ73DRAFT_82705 [Epithele typhae]|uniref:uncharacterized protein n=1 Tax=Epithele typhae TaxID=378194 RepID=UPI00200722BC|nr:uncharacterized protein BXZ73DRAFT_82705 [Epithele typhae]KAH9911568.1 hypothetical protein BXZ73DRAFT_82705 [Epithele typhae]
MSTLSPACSQPKNNSDLYSETNDSARVGLHLLVLARAPASEVSEDLPEPTGLLPDGCRKFKFESKQHEKGGHSAAYDVLEALVGDIRKFFGKSGADYGVI